MNDEADVLAICNILIPRGQQHNIEKAAGFAFLGAHAQAEVCRQAAGYGGTSGLPGQRPEDKK